MRYIDLPKDTNEAIKVISENRHRFTEARRNELTKMLFEIRQQDLIGYNTELSGDNRRLHRCLKSLVAFCDNYRLQHLHDMEVEENEKFADLLQDATNLLENTEQ